MDGGFHSAWPASGSVRGVELYCVVTMSAIDVQLWRLPQCVHVLGVYRALNVLLKRWLNRRSALPPDTSGHDRYLSRRKQRERGRGDKEEKLMAVLLGLAGVALMNERAWIFFFYSVAAGIGFGPQQSM